MFKRPSSEWWDSYWHDLEEAVSDLTDAILLDAGVEDYWYRRGLAYYWTRRYQLAIEDLTESIRLNPNVPEAYYHRGNARTQTVPDMLAPARGDAAGWDKWMTAKREIDQLAIEDYSRSIHLDARNKDALVARARLILS